jgi:hypothetical protein
VKKEVPIASEVIARRMIDEEGDEQSNVDLCSQKWGVKGFKNIQVPAY